MIELTGKEVYQIQFVLPVQGNMIALEMAIQILNKIQIKEEDINDNSIREIDFLDEEISFLKSMIKFLDNAKKLNIQGLSLYKKILEYKGVK